MDLHEIQLICALLDYKNFSDAAYNLDYSPSVITKYVAKLERELGIRLFVRSNKSRDFVPTPEGKLVLASLQRINAEYNYLLNLVHQMKTDDDKKIRIGLQSRPGNLLEQKILSSFLLENPSLNVDMVKAATDHVIQDLLTGKIDACFLTLHDDLTLKEYLGENLSRLETIYLASERDMYLGISEKYLPGVTEAPMLAFKDFVFAFPFSDSSDAQNIKAASTWIKMAAERNFDLKALYMEGYDNVLFQVAAGRPIAITTVNVPEPKAGIKFVRLIDWNGCTNLYYICLKQIQKKIVRKLTSHVKKHGKTPPSDM